MRRDYVSLQSLRAVAALAVVVFHCGGATGFESKVWERHVFDVTHPLGMLGVDLFFVISGFIMVVTTAHLTPGARTALRFLLRRASRIYPPYILVTAAVLVVTLVRPGMVNRSEGGSTSVLASFLLLPQEGTPLLLVGWTLVHEMLFYLVFTVGLLVGRRGLLAVLAGWGVATAALAMAAPEGVPPPVAPWIALGGNLLNLEFLMGALVGWLVLTRRLPDPRIVLGAGSVALVVTAWLVVATGTLPGEPLWVLGCGSALAVLLYGVVAGEVRYGRKGPRSLARVGDSSYSLYLTHVLTLGVLAVVLDRLPVGGAVGHAAGLVVAVAACLVVGHYCYLLVEVPTLTLTRRWLSGAVPSGPAVPVQRTATEGTAIEGTAEGTAMEPGGHSTGAQVS